MANHNPNLPTSQWLDLASGLVHFFGLVVQHCLIVLGHLITAREPNDEEYPSLQHGMDHWKLQIYLQDKTLRNQKDSRNGLWQQKLCLTVWLTSVSLLKQTTWRTSCLISLRAFLVPTLHRGAGNTTRWKFHKGQRQRPNPVWQQSKTAFGVENGGKTP